MMQLILKTFRQELLSLQVVKSAQELLKANKHAAARKKLDEMSLALPEMVRKFGWEQSSSKFTAFACN